MSGWGREEMRDTPFGGNTLGFMGAVASEHYLSAQAGMDMLKQGGNAFDAAAAATLVEGIVNPHMYSIGGECPMLLYSADHDEVASINGNTESPAGATLERYKKRGLDLVPPDGVLAAGVPAAFSALVEMLIRYGSLPLEVIMEPAYGLARDGFPAHDGLIAMPRFSLEAMRKKFLEEWPASAKLYLSSDGAVPSIGRRIANPATADLFSTLMETARRKGREGREEGLRAAHNLFYRGDVAAEIERFVLERHGFLTREDIAGFQTLVEEPASVDFRDTTVFKCGPWCQGPVFLQILRLLDGFSLESMTHNSADYIHLWIEAAKLAFADREQYYADPRLVSVPVTELLSPHYSDQRRSLIHMSQASRLHRPGDPIGEAPVLDPEKVFMYKPWGFGTVHVAAADAKGNMAALTPSGGWISGNEVIPSLGFPLTSRLQTFYLKSGHPNVIAPRKRPRTTLSPSLAFRRGRPWMVFGTMGGDQQDQWTNQFFLNRVVFGMSVQEAIEAPKVTCGHFPNTFYPHDAFPGQLTLEGRVHNDVVEELRSRGHSVLVGPDWSAGYICAISRNDEGLLQAGADPRGRKGSVFPSCALAW